MLLDFHSTSDGGDGKKTDRGESEAKVSIVSSSSKFLNKKRSCVQYHLEFGQSGFLLHSCSVCGMMYFCGDEIDEKLHKVSSRATTKESNSRYPLTTNQTLPPLDWEQYVSEIASGIMKEQSPKRNTGCVLGKRPYST
ncbi:hypothetical protein Cni_G01828 [Canna indica]|uniref:N-acetyltransferase ESCO zinc-finger domain-containing protein n=1 Tax=Canna indica TaxID=4628 RepID=A0AAQ3PYV8_9LILI|nr:hypothetical protein Cni_G01828 [Canna indica]